MKNAPVALFTVGLIIGSILMCMVLGFLQFPGHWLSPRAAPFSPTPDRSPHLIALEPTTARRPATATPTWRVVTTDPTVTPIPKSVRPTATPLKLQNDARTETIGYSVEGRPLQVYTFGKGEQERMIVAGIHGGDEWNTVNLANQLIEYLDQDPGSIPENVKLYIMPNLNPDGEARAHDKYGRLNHHGVDLNRNFPVNWKKAWDRSGCWDYLPTSGGAGPGSEAETRLLMNFIETHHIQALISYHSAGLGIFPGGFPWDKNAIRLAKSLALVTSYPFPPLDTGCAYSGTLADYAVSQGIAAVDLELTNHIDTDFEQNLQALDVLMNFVP